MIVESSSETTRSDKRKIRQECLRKRRQLETDERQAADRAICRRLEQLPEVRQFNNIAAFLSDGSEPDLAPWLKMLLNSGKKVFLPRTTTDGYGYEMAEASLQPDKLRIGQYGIIEPIAEQPAAPINWDNVLWLIPGVAFDVQGHRLGRGKGIYDRLLAATGIQSLTVGVFYQCQQVVAVPTEAHDYRLNIIITETATCRLNME